jgi:F0F1-type ATP synthase beta subunit
MAHRVNLLDPTEQGAKLGTWGGGDVTSEVNKTRLIHHGKHIRGEISLG